MRHIPAHAKFPEQRKRNPARLYYPGQIVMGDGLPNRSCILRDISTGGGRISAEVIHDVPDKFVLLLSADGRVARLCETQWRFDNQIGVRFLKGPIPACSRIDANSGVELIFI